MKRFLTKLFSLIILIEFLITPLTNSNYLDTETSTGNTFTAGCWSPPNVPVLVNPSDNSYSNGTNITLDWNESVFSCPGQTVSYIVDWNGTELPEQSASEITFPVDEGTYYWQVKAKTDGHESAYSNPRTITVDRTAPITTLSFNGKIINEKVLNGGFESGTTNWQIQGQVVTQAADTYTSPYSGSKMLRIGHRTAVTGNEIWENRLRQRLPSGAKNLSFYYNFFSFDTDPFDSPGMVVRLNDYNVFYLSAGDIDAGDNPNSSGWTQVSFDLTGITDPILEIVFYSGNTDGNTNQSWVYIDNVSTAEAVATDTTDFTLTSDESAQTYYSLDGGVPLILGNSFNLSTLIGDNIRYYSVDLAGNAENYQSRRVVKDTQAPAAITDLTAVATSKQTINLSWIAPADTTIYDIRYSLTPITDSNFASATSIPNSPAPIMAGATQEWEIGGMNSDTNYYFAMKAGDAALNWSSLSNNADAVTLDEITEDPDINSGDVVLNELMWMGTSRNVNDEWVELRNMTDRSIDLSGWQLTKNVSGVETLMFTIPSGIINLHSYFLISEFNKANSAINVDPDVIVGAGNTNDSNFALTDTGLQIKLYKGDWTNPANLVDTADNATAGPAAGAHSDSLSRHWSMERDGIPGNGADANVWHTTLDDSDLMHSYWDSGRLDQGTPGKENLSQTVSAIPLLITDLNLSYASHSAGFIVTNTIDFNQLKYALTYESDSGPQGIVGTVEINGQNFIEVKNLITGTCSSGGTCVYHENIKLINLNVVLSGSIERTLTKSLAL